jgi:hypothetical protein|tara:strand:+ start:273 stop:527 length:255 start_codon:yes stop_codon:yes gene_type:complete
MKKFLDFISSNPIVSVGILFIIGPLVYGIISFQFGFKLPEWFIIISFFSGLTLIHIGTSRYGEWKKKDEYEEALKRSKENKDNT